MITGTDVKTIVCDKCGTCSTAKDFEYNDVFWKEGWALNNGRKYEHLCYNCLPRKKQKSMDWLKQLMG